MNIRKLLSRLILWACRDFFEAQYRRIEDFANRTTDTNNRLTIKHLDEKLDRKVLELVEPEAPKVEVVVSPSEIHHQEFMRKLDEMISTLRNIR